MERPGTPPSQKNEASDILALRAWLLRFMAAVSEDFALCTSILDVVFKLQHINEDWFTVSDECRAMVLVLSANLKIVRDHLDYRADDDRFVKILKSAEAKVRKEKLKVEKLQGRIDNDKCWAWGWWIWAKVTALLFPQTLEQTIKDVTEEINKIPALLFIEGEVYSQFYKLDQCRSTFYDNDGLYVPLRRTQAAVMESIEKGLNYVPRHGTKSAVITPIENGRLVVLLHGGVGTGKTILARYVYKFYQGSTLFDHVHYEPCGPNFMSDPSTKMLDILNSLSPPKVSASPKTAQMVSRARIISQLKNFLKGKRVLIILDHVADEEFLLEMRNAAQGCPNVKYLVTTQITHLCHYMRHDAHEILMENTTRHEAREILASLLGLEPRVIPIKLQEVTENVITATEGNPLALACWAGHFYSSQNKTNEQAWWDAYGSLRTILDSSERKLVLGSSQRRRLWEAMDLCIKSSEVVDAKLIFFFIYACPGASVSEEVLKNWHDSITTSGTFWKSADVLSWRGLLEGVRSGGGPKAYSAYEGDQNLHQSMGESTAWSLRPLVKLYMGYLMASTNGTMEKEISLLMYTLLGDKNCSPDESSIQPKSTSAIINVKSETDKVAIALCALYFDPAHADPQVKSFAKRARSALDMADTNNNVIYRRRQAIEPIIWLLGQAESTKWTEERHSSARKILITYVFEHRLHGDGFAALLTLDTYPPAQVAAVTALLSIFTVEEGLLQFENARSLMLALFVLLDSKARYSTSFNEAAVKALGKVLGSLFQGLSQPDEPDLHLQAAMGLAIIAFGDKDSIGTKVVTENKAVADLLKSLSKHDQGHLQEQVTGALRKVASSCDDSTDMKIVSEEGVLAELVKILSEPEKYSILLEDTLCTLWELTNSDDGGEFARAAIANEPGAAACIVQFLGEGNAPLLQKKAVTIVANIAFHDSLIPKLVSESGVSSDVLIAGLVRLLSENPSQEEAARALCNLSSTGVLATCLRKELRKEDGVLSAVVKCLDADNETELRDSAVRILRNLLQGSDKSYKLAVANHAAGALEGLLKALSELDKPDLQLEAGKAVCELVKSTDESIKLKIINADGVVDGLVEALSEMDKSEWQESATDILWYLAEVEDKSGRRNLKNKKGLLEGLVNLSKQDDPDLRRSANGALKALR